MPADAAAQPTEQDADAALFERLAALGIATRTVEHPAVFTVAESSELERSLPGGHTKNLFLKDDKGRLVLVIAEGRTRVDLKSLSKKLGAGRFSFGKPELLMEILGVTPGSVNAFAVMNDRAGRTQVVFDRNLMAHETVNCHPMRNTATTNIAREDLLRFIRESGHEPRILELEAPAPAEPPAEIPTQANNDRHRRRSFPPSTGRHSQRAKPQQPLPQAGLKHEENAMDFGARKPAAGPAPIGDVVKDTTTAGFAKDVLEASRAGPVLVDFWAPWCGPCKQLTPIIEKVVRSYNGKVRLVKVNIDENQALAAQLGVQSVPTVYAFRDGRPLDGFMGAQPEKAVRAFIDRIMGDEAEADIAGVLTAAEQALDAGDLQGAAEIFAAVLQEDQQNVQALAGLALCYLKSGDAARAEQTLELVPPDQHANSAVQGVRAALDLAKKASQPDNRMELLSRLAANAADHQARFDLAVLLAARDEKAEALDHLLEIVKRDRNWNEQGARKQMVQLFEAWGPKDPLTLEGRRRLSSILFS